VLNLPASTEAFHPSFIFPEKTQQIFNPINWLSKIRQDNYPQIRGPDHHRLSHAIPCVPQAT
jgi:hypothetical protein